MSSSKVNRFSQTKTKNNHRPIPHISSNTLYKRRLPIQAIGYIGYQFDQLQSIIRRQCVIYTLPATYPISRVQQRSSVGSQLIATQRCLLRQAALQSATLAASSTGTPPLPTTLAASFQHSVQPMTHTYIPHITYSMQTFNILQAY